MTQGVRGSGDTFCTRPPSAKARPEGVRMDGRLLRTEGRVLRTEAAAGVRGAAAGTSGKEGVVGETLVEEAGEVPQLVGPK